MEFVALDVETANADLASICQIGMARFRDRNLVEEWKTFVDPEDYFDFINISIHGITESTVKGAPTLPVLAERIRSFLDGRIAVSHTHFDRVAIRQGCEKYGLQVPSCTWLDSARIARRAWHQFARAGYGLENVCSVLGYSFRAHDALEDAKAAAAVLLAAINETGISLCDWPTQVTHPIDPFCLSGRLERDGNPEGSLYGETVAFTGALTMPRSEMASRAASAGLAVGAGVTRDTTILVVGNQDVRKLAGKEKSIKHRKAEELIRKGHQIRILKESDFEELIHECASPRI